MIVEVRDEAVPRLAVMLRQAVREYTRNGRVPPPALTDLLDQLGPSRNAERNRVIRARHLSAQRMRRYRARKRAQVTADSSSAA